MSLPDELASGAAANHGSDEGLDSVIRRLVVSQPYAVLCTQGQGQPYGSLVAYAMTPDLTSAVFATPRATRKFRLLSECDHVALLIDNRSEFPGQLMEVEAVTATGRAAIVEEGTEFERWARLLTDRHAYLAQFVRSASCGLFRISIVRYFHVTSLPRGPTVGPQESWIIPLVEATDCAEELVGGKAAKLAALLRAGFTVPNGFCITTRAYEQFVAETGLATCVAMELGRKSLDHARWEELWDAALRIRSEFLRAEIPASISAEICRALAEHVGDSIVAVRSSAPGEDSRHVSFAGLHESVVGVQGGRAVLDAVRTVWASLWSDAALLYRRELALDPRRSRMAVLVQEMKLADCSGVAFARDPRDPEADCAVVEAVPGQCALLVDGSVDPDRWMLQRSSGELLEWRPGNRGQETQEPLLDQADLAHLLGTLQRVEDLFAWPPDVEWTGRRRRPWLCSRLGRSRRRSRMPKMSELGISACGLACDA